MFERLSEESGNVIAYRVKGKLTEEDYKAIEPEIDRFIEEKGTLRMFVDLQEFESIDAGAIKADFELALQVRNEIEKLVIVGDEKWQEWMTMLSRPLTSGEVRYFYPSQSHAAWEWVQNGEGA